MKKRILYIKGILNSPRKGQIPVALYIIIFYGILKLIEFMNYQIADNMKNYCYNGIVISCLLVLVFMKEKIKNFSKGELNWYKMLGIRNLDIFFISIAKSKNILLFYSSTVTLIGTIIVGKNTEEIFFWSFWYYITMYSFLYIINIVMGIYPRIVKKIFRLCILIGGVILGTTLFEYKLFSFFSDKVSQIEHTIIFFIGNTNHNTLKVLFLSISFVLFCLELIFIHKYQLMEYLNITNKNSKILSNLCDRYLKYRKGKLFQIMKIKYLLFLKNRDWIAIKIFFLLLWPFIFFASKNQGIIFCFTIITLELINASVLYRMKEESNNFYLYRCLGYPIKKFFWHSVLSTFLVSSDFIFVICLIGVIQNRITFLSFLGIFAFALYITLFFHSFILYFTLVKGADVNSKFFEMIVYIVGGILCWLPIGIYVIIKFLMNGKVIKNVRNK